MTSSLEQLIEVARDKFAFKEKEKLILMLEEDETEVQDEDYFQSLEKTTKSKMLMHIWRSLQQEVNNNSSVVSSYVSI